MIASSKNTLLQCVKNTNSIKNGNLKEGNQQKRQT